MKKPDLNKPVFKLFPDKANRVREEICTNCNTGIDEMKFRDELSLKEYGISGMCQGCQDLIFGGNS